MVERLQQTLASLYEQDETAWLDVMAELVAQKRFEEMDCANLSEYLESMTKRDRRAVFNRLVVLLTHLLKWDHQVDQRTHSWRGTIRAQRRKLGLLLESGTLRRHAAEVLAEAHQEAVEQAADETGLPKSQFPRKCSRALDQILSGDLD